MSKEKIFTNVERALVTGNLWRAKEILQGNISSSCGYDIEIYEKYGQVLLRMGDLLEAGKYLFLCGKRQADYEKPIELYLKRFSKVEPTVLFHTFPKASRLRKLNDYPDNVQQFLISRGCTDKDLDKYVPKPVNSQKQSFFSKIIEKVGCLIMLLLLCAFVVGVLGVIRYGFHIIKNWFTH
jgi:hypothetical protein